MRLFLCLCLGFWPLISSAQLPAIGSWQSHLPYGSVIAVAEGPNQVFAATPYSLFEVDKTDGSFFRLNTVTGLSDMRVASIAYDSSSRTLVIAYENSVIDLYRLASGAVVNLADIQRNSNLTGSRRVNDIFTQAGFAYLACDFGLVKLNLNRAEFTANTFTPNLEVLSATVFEASIFMATPAGIYRVDTALNINDFGNWQKQGAAVQLPSTNYLSQSLAVFKGKLYADVNDTLKVYDGQSWSKFGLQDRWSSDSLNYYYNSLGISKLRASEDRLVVSTNRAYFDAIFPNQSYIRRYVASNGGQVDALRDEQGRYWVGFNGSGLYRVNTDNNIDHIVPNGPRSASITDMAVSESGRLWCTAGGVVNNYVGYQFSQLGYYVYGNGTWENFNQNETDFLTETFDFITVAAHPSKDEVFLGSFFSGLLQVTADSVKFYREGTPGCTLQEANGDIRTRVSGLAFDEEENLWVANHLASLPLSVRKADGSWQAFSLGSNAQIANIAIDRNGYKWIQGTRSNLLVFDEGDFDTNTDDRFIEITTTNSELPSGIVNCVTADLNGGVWVGTAQGIVIFRCGDNVFDGECLGNRPIVTQDNFNAYLLETENINDIAVDGANRKWVATNNGVFLFSEDGLDQVHFFDESNSPLFSNNVNSLAVDAETGLVYMATDAGLIAYRGEATEGKNFASRDLAYAFPNPVRPEYEGTIAITKLVDNANVKITDINGQLVHETTALGGQAVWNGRDYTGRRVSSGVYLVFVVNDSGLERMVTKLLFLQ